MRNMIYRTILALLVGVAGAPAAYGVSDDFSSDPLAGGSPWSFGQGSNANSQFSWSPGELTVHVDTSLPTVRLDLPLGLSLSDTDSFVLSAQFSFQVISAPTFQFAQFAFGLANHTLTGGDRTGTPGNFDSANTYHTVEFDYYPNVSPPFGATLSPAVFGGQPVDGNAFHNFASIFGPGSDLGDNTVGITSLPEDTVLEAQLVYDAATRIITLSMYQVESDSSLTLLNTELTPLDIGAFDSGYDTLNPFSVDSLSLMAYFDAFTSSQDPSLVADVTYHSISLTVPEPSTVALSLVGSLLAIATAIGRSRLRRALASSARPGLSRV